MNQKSVPVPLAGSFGTNLQPIYFRLNATSAQHAPVAQENLLSLEQAIVGAAIKGADDVSQMTPQGSPKQSALGVCAVAPNRGVDISGDGYLRLKQVLNVYPVSRAAWYEGMSDGIYPASVPLGKRSVGWTRESIRQLIANPPVF